MVRRGKVDSMKQCLPSLVQYRPDLVFLLAGGNDIRIDSIPKQIAREMEELAETIAKVSGANVIVGSLFRRERPRIPYGIYEEIRVDVKFWSVVSHASPGPTDVWVDCTISSEMVFISPKIKSSSTGPFVVPSFFMVFQ